MLKFEICLHSSKKSITLPSLTNKKGEYNMDKIYLVIQDYVTDLNTEFKVNAYKTIERAKAALKEAVKESKPMDKDNDFEVETDTDTEYEAYLDGEYIDNHSHIYIEEVKVEDWNRKLRILNESVKVKLKPKKNLEITKTFITLPTLNKKTR